MNKPKSFFGLTIDDPNTPKKLLLGVIVLWAMNGIVFYWLDDRGTFGDMFGSINALFSGLAFAGIIYTILLQREELNEQREELKLTRAEFEKQNRTMRLQRFENSFFNLLASRRELIQTLKFVGENYVNYNGTDVIAYVNSILKKGLQGIELDHAITKFDIEGLRERYFGILPTYTNQVNLFLDSLLAVLEFVAYSDLIEDDDERRKYFSIVASQLTIAERTFIYYYLCIDFSAGHMQHNRYHRIEKAYRFITMQELEYFHLSHASLFGWWEYLEGID